MSLISTFRILKRDRISLVTNMTGLSFGLATAILLAVFIQYELSFDQHFANSERIRDIPVRISRGADVPEVIDRVAAAIQTFNQDYILMRRFASDSYQGYYQDEQGLRNILGIGSLLAMSIVMMGIFALSSHNILRRTKEIGVRKVMGGSSVKMLLMVYRSTLQWTLIASLISIPLCWIFLNKCLNTFSLRIPLYWWILVLSILLVLVFETLITLAQTWKAANRNPVEALRYE